MSKQTSMVRCQLSVCELRWLGSDASKQLGCQQLGCQQLMPAIRPDASKQANMIQCQLSACEWSWLGSDASRVRCQPGPMPAGSDASNQAGCQQAGPMPAIRPDASKQADMIQCQLSACEWSWGERDRSDEGMRESGR